MPTRFCGRKQELSHLQDAWQAVASGEGPRVVVLLGDSGVGKTRLVQEFYGWLSGQYRSEDDRGYWPPSLTEAGRNLLINPPLEEIDSDQNPPFLWWGIRLSNSGDHNSAGPGAVWRALTHLDAHLAPIERARRHKRYWLDQLGQATRAGLNFIPIAGPIVSLGDHAIDLITREIERQRDGEARDLSDDERAHRLALTERIVTKLGLLMRPRNDVAPIPMVWLIDDAHQSPSDPGVTELLDHVTRDATTDAWPLLTIVTHWAQPWHEELAGHKSPAIATTLTELGRTHLPGVEPLELHAMDSLELGPMLDDCLPGLTPEQRGSLLARTGGQPRFLDELTRFCLAQPRLFLDRDSNRALTSAGLDEALHASTNLHDLVHRRLNAAPHDVRDMITLASPQGTRLLHSITQRLVDILRVEREDLLPAGEPWALDRAERPYSFINRTGTYTAEYSFPIYHEVATSNAANIIDPTTLDHAFRRAVREEHDQRNTMADANDHDLLLEITANTLEHSPDSGDRATAARALATLTRHARHRYEPLLAAQNAERISAGVDRGAWTWTDLGFAATKDVVAAFGGAQLLRRALPVAWALVDLATDDAESATALEQIGESLFSAGDLAEAGEAWREALSMRRRTVEQRADPDRLFALSDALDRVGRHAMKLSDLPGAASAFEEAVAIDERLHAELGSPASERHLSRTLSHTADVLRRQGRLSAAQERYERALEIRNRLHESLPTPQSERDLSLTLTRIGDVFQRQDDLPAALERYQDVLERRRRLHARLGTPQSERELSLTLTRIADILRKQGDLTTALENYEEVLETRQRLHARLGTPQSERELSLTVARIADILQRRDDLPAALEHYEAVLETRQRLHARLGTPQSERELSLTRSRIGDILQQQGDLRGARTRFEDVLETRRGLHARLGTPQSARELAKACHRLGALRLELGWAADAVPLMEHAVQHYRALGDRNESPSLHDLGRALRDGGEHARAAECHAAEYLLRKGSGDDSGRAIALASWGLALVRADDATEGMRKLETAHTIATTAADECTVHLVLKALGEAHFATGNPGAARKQLGHALQRAEGAALHRDAHHVALLLAKLEIAAGDATAARAAARAALSHAGTVPHLVGRAWAALADTALAADRLDAGAAALLMAWERLDTAGHAHAESAGMRLHAIWNTEPTTKAFTTSDRTSADRLIGDLVGQTVHPFANLPPDRFADLLRAVRAKPT